MEQQRKATAWWGRLALLSALLLGIVAMHTLGHASGQHEGSPPAPAAVTVAADTGHNGHDASKEAAAGSSHSPSSHAPGSHSRGSDTDPTSACLAMLGMCAFVLLSAAYALGRPYDPLRAVRAALPRVPWSLPPPRQSVHLAQLSVLRI